MKTTISKIQNELSSLFWNFFIIIFLFGISVFLIQINQYFGYIVFGVIFIIAPMKFYFLQEKIKKKLKK